MSEAMYEQWTSTALAERLRCKPQGCCRIFFRLGVVPIMFSVDWIWISFYLFVDWSKHYSTFCWIIIHDFRFSLIRFKRVDFQRCSHRFSDSLPSTWPLWVISDAPSQKLNDWQQLYSYFLFPNMFPLITTFVP